MVGKISYTLNSYLVQERRGWLWMQELTRVWRLIGFTYNEALDTWEGTGIRRSIYDDLDTGGYGEGAL